jgi:uncharacterized membrane protein
MVETTQIDPHGIVASANRTFVVAATTAAALLVPAAPVAQAVGIVGLVVLVGAFLTSLVATTATPIVHRLAICVGTGFVFFIGFGALLGSVLPHLGVGHPLSRIPLLIAWIALEVAVVTCDALRQRDSVHEVLEGMRLSDAVWAALLSIPVILSIYGAVHLNAGGGPLPAIAAAVVTVALVIVAIALPNGSAGPPRVLLLISAFVTCALQGPLRGGWLAGVDIQHESFVGKLAIAQGVFPLQHYSDPYGGMLSLTVFPAELHALVGMTLRGVLAFVPSVFLGLALLTTWATVRERLSPRTSALLCTVFIVGCEPLVRQLPQVTRQCYALFFFALLVLAVTSKRIPVRTARWLACVSTLGIAMTHYTSAYFAALAVLFGCAFGFLLRTERGQRVLTLPVTSAIVGVTALWDAAIAKSQSNVVQLYTAIRTDGLRLLPGKGSIWSRFLHGSTTGVIGSWLNGSVVGNTLVAVKSRPVKHSPYSWMLVLRSAKHVEIQSVHTATVSGVHGFGSALHGIGATLTEVVLVIAVLSVVACLWKTRDRRVLAGIAGMGLCFLGISGLSRLSGTISVDFGPSRVEAQAYLLFIATAAIAFEGMTWGRLEALRRRLDSRRLLLIAGVGVAALAISTSSELSNLAEPGAQPPAELASTGQQAERLLAPDDVLAAGWVAAHRANGALVQADLYGQFALDDFGFNTRRGFVPVVKPTIVDDHSWLFAFASNVVDRTAFQSTSGSGVESFCYPMQFFASTRSVLYISSTDVVFGQVPQQNWGLVYHRPKHVVTMRCTGVRT